MPFDVVAGLSISIPGENEKCIQKFIYDSLKRRDNMRSSRRQCGDACCTGFHPCRPLVSLRSALRLVETTSPHPSLCPAHGCYRRLYVLDQLLVYAYAGWSLGGAMCTRMRSVKGTTRTSITRGVRLGTHLPLRLSKLWRHPLHSQILCWSGA